MATIFILLKKKFLRSCHPPYNFLNFRDLLGIGFFTDIDFGFLGGFLLISLTILIMMSLINIIFIKSKFVSLIRAYVGAVIFTLYLLYDFNRLEKFAGDESWATAIEISVNIYLDIINLFMDLLEILSESN